MEEVTYPNITPSNNGWKVQTSKGSSIPGFFTSLRIAQQALRSHNIKAEVVRLERATKKAKQESKGK
jgi:hypothetical protein